MINDIYEHTIHYNGLEFNSNFKQKHYDRVRKPRLNKKLKLGKWFELGAYFTMRVKYDGVSFFSSYDHLLDALLSEDSGLVIAFMGAENIDNHDEMVVTIIIEYDHRQDGVLHEVVDITNTHFEVLSTCINGLVDMNG